MLSKLTLIINIIFYTFTGSCVYLLDGSYRWLLFLVPIALLINIFAGKADRRIPGKRLKLCNHGTKCLIVFYASGIAGATWHVWLAFQLIPDRVGELIISVIIFVLLELIIFWNGIISVYTSSVQLGIKIRVIGLVLGCIPIANLVALVRIICVCRNEVKFETEKYYLNLERADEQVCRTKYPILLVHGVFFRDMEHLNYWGRIPDELIANGATVYYGEHSSALSVSESAREITERIKEIVDETGCGKVNIIAHSKGGLDCRDAIARGAGDYVASLTTISTPHRGCGFADYLLEKMPERIKGNIANTYNAAAKKFGDRAPDFMAAVTDLTAENCRHFDTGHPLPENIYCVSVGSVLGKAAGGKFPLNFSYNLVKFFDGENDGLVSVDSFQWGEEYTLLHPPYKRGISHGDMIDLNRENIRGFDVREFYVQLVSKLRTKGY